MDVENFIKQEALWLKGSRRNVEVAPEINDKHFDIIKRKYAGTVPTDFQRYVLVMSYTVAGFFFMTGDTFYFDNFMQGGLRKVKFKEIQRVDYEEGKLFSCDKFYIFTTTEKLVLDGCIDGMNLPVLKNVFQHIIDKSKEKEEFTISEQGILSADLPEDLKLIYLEILCNYAYMNDSVIDSNEYNAITKFSVRMEMQGETRGRLRQYMNNFDKRIKTGVLLAELKKRTENQSGYWDVIKYCIMQDALCIHKIQSPEKPWCEDGFIGSLMEKCGLCPDQLETMEKAVSLNQQMQMREADMGQLKDQWKKLIKSIHGTKRYVPAPYLFCSGSVYGLKTYNGFLKKDDTSQKAVNKQRELILQEIIINNQKAVNVLIGDMNYLAERLEDSLETEEKIRKDYEKIKQLLKRIKSAKNFVYQEEEYMKTMAAYKDE